MNTYRDFHVHREIKIDPKRTSPDDATLKSYRFKPVKKDSGPFFSKPLVFLDTVKGGWGEDLDYDSSEYGFDEAIFESWQGDYLPVIVRLSLDYCTHMEFRFEFDVDGGGGDDGTQVTAQWLCDIRIGREEWDKVNAHPVFKGALEYLDTPDDLIYYLKDKCKQEKV